MSCLVASEDLPSFFSVFPAVGFAVPVGVFAADFTRGTFAEAIFPEEFPDALGAGFGADFGAGLAETFGLALLEGFTGVFEAGFGAVFGAVFGAGLATAFTDFCAGLAAGLAAFGEAAGAFFASGLAADGFDADLAAGLETGFAGFFTLEDTGLTGFTGFFSPFDAPNFTTVPADALEGFAFITAFAGFFVEAATALVSGLRVLLPIGFISSLAFAAGFDFALFGAPFGAFFFADGMGLGDYWVGSPRFFRQRHCQTRRKRGACCRAQSRSVFTLLVDVQTKTGIGPRFGEGGVEIMALSSTFA